MWKIWNFFIRVFSSYNTIIQDTLQRSPQTLKRSAFATSRYLAVNQILEGMPQNYRACITHLQKQLIGQKNGVIYMQNKKIQFLDF